jgi:uncharacterized protein (DUF433 family)
MVLVKPMAKDKLPAVHSDPEILGGTPVFVGTRVPFENLVDYLEAGHKLSEFLDDFPTVTREQVLAALKEDRSFDRDLLSDPRFLARIEAARRSLREGRGIPL